MIHIGKTLSLLTSLTRPFPKLEGRRNSNEKGNHSAQLGFEFQASRLQNLFVQPGFIDMAVELRGDGMDSWTVCCDKGTTDTFLNGWTGPK